MATTGFNIDFENMFKVMIFGLRMNRSYPDIKRDWKWILFFVLAHGIFFLLYFVLMYTIFFHDLKNNDINQACANGIITVIFDVVTLKYIVLLTYQNIFFDMICKVKQDYELAKSFSEKEQKVVLNYAQKGEALVKLWLVICIVTPSLFPIKSIILMIYYYVTDEFTLVHMYELTYPAFIEEVKYEWHVFIAINMVYVFYAIYAAFMYVGFSPLTPILLLHACGQLELATSRLLSLYENEESEDIKLRKLRDIIIHTQDIYSFVSKIKKSMMFFYELILKTAVILIPVTVYQIIKSSQQGDFRVEFLSVLFGAVLISAMPCYYSDMLLDSNENMRQAVYMCGWECHPHIKTRRLLKLLLLRASRPTAMETVFKTISLDALTEVYQQAYTLFNLMNAAL